MYRVQQPDHNKYIRTRQVKNRNLKNSFYSLLIYLLGFDFSELPRICKTEKLRCSIPGDFSVQCIVYSLSNKEIQIKMNKNKDLQHSLN